nr:MAG TPA: hypothetical protein [Inoviridae sp.]
MNEMENVSIFYHSITHVYFAPPTRSKETDYSKLSSY